VVHSTQTAANPQADDKADETNYHDHGAQCIWRQATAKTCPDTHRGGAGARDVRLAFVTPSWVA
jgi:hypothetical protein